MEAIVREDAAAFAERAIAACAADPALGAYADATSIRYLYLGEGGPRELAYALGEDRAAVAVSDRVPLFSWDEREMREERDVRFTGLADARPLRAAPDGTMPAARTASGIGVMRFVVGPVHAGIIEPGRFTFSSGGETVVALDAQLGYQHRGVEVRLEGMTPLAAAPLVARICGGCSAARSYAYALALETLAGIPVDRATNFERAIAAELERLYNHLADLAACAAGAGWGPGFARGMALKERVMRLAHARYGHRLLFDAIVPGGVTACRPAGFADELRAVAAASEGYVRSLFGNTSLVSRWQGAGHVPAATAREFGVVGPPHRASGGTVDVRSRAPYGAYERLRVNVATASGGDALARSRVKADEIAESLRLIAEASMQLDAASAGPARAFDVPDGRAVGVVEGPRGAETVALEVAGGRLRRFHAISASYRNWPAVALAMDGNIVPDFPLVNKSFNLCYACADR